MSDPLSSLKKSKHSPFGRSHHHGPSQAKNSNVPYRYGDDSLLEEVTTRMATKNPLHTERHVSDTPSDIDLMQTMVSRIAILEKHIQIQAKQIQDKDRRINVLEDKCRLYKSMNSGETASNERIKELETRCLRLQQQISDMEDFLLDYGMVWVGQSSDEEEDTNEAETGTTISQPGKMWNPETSVPDRGDGAAQPAAGDDNPYNIDFDTIVENVQELNIVAKEGEAQIEQTPSGARFKVPDPVQLILYKNGMVMFDGPFRPYSDKSTQICLADLLDGYFPTELQKRYPDGVPFKLVDKRSVTFSQNTTKSFSGSGQSLGGVSTPSRLVPSILNPSGSDKTAGPTEFHTPGKKLTADQFLSKLPKSVISNGKVIDIRSSLSENLTGDTGGSQCPVTVVETQTMSEIKDRLDIDENLRPPSGRNITTLRVKDTDNHVYIIKMKFTDTIGDVVSYLDEVRKSTGRPYSLMTTFPSKVYTDLAESLFDAGLTPNAAMHIRERKP